MSIVITNTIFGPHDLTPHLVMANKLSRLVWLKASDSALYEFRSDGSALGDGYNVATQILPITRFGSIDDVERLANDVELMPAVGPANVRDEMPGIFYELALNAVQHSQSAVGYYVILELSTDVAGEIVYAIGVADCGIGIPASLRENPDFEDILNDADAIARATELNVTGTGEAERGLGLDHIMNVVQRFGGNCVIISGGGYLNVTNGLEIVKGNLNSADRIPGTVVVVTLSVPALR
jgi:signal transduction histidine kinase